MFTCCILEERDNKSNRTGSLSLLDLARKVSQEVCERANTTKRKEKSFTGRKEANKYSPRVTQVNDAH